MTKNILNSKEVFSHKLISEYPTGNSVFSAVSAAKVVSLSAEKVIKYVNNFSCYLHSIGIKQGDRVITSLSHNIDWNIIEYSLLRLGAIHIPLAPNYLERDLIDIVEVASPNLFITNSAFHCNKLERLSRSLDLKTPLFKFKLHSLENPLTSGMHNHLTPLDIPEDDIAVILFTSGSSNKSKAVPLSYKNILTSIDDFSTNDLFDDSNICLDILHHSFSGGRKVNYSELLRGKHICYANSTLSLIDNINFYKADMVTCVPYFVNQILDYLKLDNEIRSLRKIICGGAPLNPETIIELKQYGIVVYNVYGLTETASLCSYNTNKNHKIGSAGKISTKIQYKINRKNELLLKGDSVFAGYLTKDGIVNPYDEDGWFNTGDIVKIDDDGFLFILGRNSSFVKTQKGKFINLDDYDA